MVLVRDRAADFHPVIGIAALSSAAVAVTVRDERIGWTPDRLLAEIAERPTARLARWMQKKVDEAVSEIYKVDLFEDEVLSPRDLKEPTPELTARLDRLAKQWRLEHYRYMRNRPISKRVSAEERRAGRDWEKEARKLLFRSKRAHLLGQLLSARIAFLRFFGDKPSREGLRRLTADGRGREAVGKVLRKVKANRVGTAIADLTVCGAVPPYNECWAGN